VRRPKTDRVPRTRAGGEWTEASFWGFIRSGLRQLSRRWPPRAKVIRDKRVPYIGPNKRQKWAISCDCCGHLHQLAHVQVDHIVSCGPLKSFSDLPGFVERLLCEADGLRVLCSKCHEKRHFKKEEG